MAYEALILVYTSIMSGWSGGSLRGHRLFGKFDFLPEFLFALPFALVLYPLIGWYGLAAVPWSYAWKQTGHANALNWGSRADHKRTNTLTPLVDWIADKLNIKIFGRGYSFLFFAVKGFLITLPVGGSGVLFYPLGYDIGVNLERKGMSHSSAHTISEVLSGFGAGLSIVLFYMVVLK